MALASKDWAETIQPNETEDFEKFSTQFALLQRVLNKKFGKGRILHRKSLAHLKAKLEIFQDIPATAKQGLFKESKSYECLVRLSNGSLEIQEDNKPDIRGFALKVLGVEGKGALGETTNCQDFLMINQVRFSSPTALPFLEVVLNAALGPKALFQFFLKKLGFFATIGKLIEMNSIFNRPFKGFAFETFNTVAPHQIGEFAGRVRLRSMQEPSKFESKKSYGKEFWETISKQDLTYALEIQFFINENETPIENASIEWKESHSPFVTVGKLTIPQCTESPAEFQSEVEAMHFDPWNGLLEHKPLGNIMRARKIFYHLSQKGRKEKAS